MKYQLYQANKQTVTKEYYHRIKKIWNSELSLFNKIIAHNTFAVTVFITSVGIVDWILKKIRKIDCKRRKQLAMAANFHPNGDVDRLYIPRSEGGRGLMSIVRMYESRIVSVAQHLEFNKSHKLVYSLLLSRNKYRQISQFPIEERSLCNIRAQELLISNSKPRASNKILALQTGPRQR